VSFVALAARPAPARVRAALSRALGRLPGTVVHEAEAHERLTRLRQLAHADGVEWIICVDADAVLAPDAFAGLRRALAERPAMLGGRGTIDGQPYFGAMFAPVRSGPNPFELAWITGFEQRGGVNELVRGPIDVAQRGAFVLDAGFVRALPPEFAADDDATLFLDLAVWARRLGRTVRCEPVLAFEVERDDVIVRERLLDLRRFASLDAWDPARMWRQPPGLRAYLIDRDTRIDGNFRGFEKRPLPPLETITYGSGDVARVRRALARTGDRYVLLVPDGQTVARPEIEALVARLERSARHVLALQRDEPPYGAVLVGAGRLPLTLEPAGGDVTALIAGLIAALPATRLYAVGPRGPHVPDVLPPFPAMGSLDIIFVAAAQPNLVGQTLQAVVRENAGPITAVYPADAETVRRTLESYSEVRVVADGVDPTLGRGLNRVLAGSRADAIAIVRDDVLVSSGLFTRLVAAFGRVARLGAIVPRMGGPDRPEGVPEITYNSATEMQVYADRQAIACAREASLLSFATAPMIVVSRTALDLVGPFDERFGFSRFGTEDLTRRMVAANLTVAVAEDCWAHLFPGFMVESLLAPLDASSAAAAAVRERWHERDSFDVARDRVPFPVGDDAAVAPVAGRRQLLFIVASPQAWESLRPHFAAVAATFRAADPIDVAIAVAEGVSLPSFAAALRDVLIAAPVPLEQTVEVHVESVRDLSGWVAAKDRPLRFAAMHHDALDGVPAVDDIEALRAALRAETVG
jgi:GT2 family glycosyltransferase